MRPFIVILFLLFLNSGAVKAQNKEFSNALLHSDSIYLVSQKLLFGVIEDSVGNFQRLSLLKDGRINKSIILQQAIVPDSIVMELVYIFEKPFSDKKVETCKSFASTNGILLFKNGKITAYQISFPCNSYEIESSPERYFLDNEAQRRLQAAFRYLNIQVE